MSDKTGWFIAGLILLSLAAMSFPKATGWFLLLLVMFLLISATRKNIL